MSIEAARQSAFASLRATGYALLADFDGERLVELAECFGSPSADTRSAEIITDLRPQGSEAARVNTLSHRFGMGAFPFHTETAYWREPARYVFLYCRAPGKGNRPTLVVDVTPHLSSAETRVLKEGLWIVGRSRRTFLARTLESSVHGIRLRYDPACMTPAERQGAEARSVLAEVVDRQVPVSVEWATRDLLIIDNHRVIHGRGESSVPDPDRHLQRVLVATDALR